MNDSILFTKFIKLQMKGLKQTLGKEDIKKKKKNNFTTTLGKMKKTEWN